MIPFMAGTIENIFMSLWQWWENVWTLAGFPNWNQQEAVTPILTQLSAITDFKSEVDSLPAVWIFSIDVILFPVNSNSQVMSSFLCRCHAGFLGASLRIFFFQVKGREWKRLLQVILAPQTKLRGKGKSVRGEVSCSLRGRSFNFIRHILPVPGRQGSDSDWLLPPVHRSQTPPLLHPPHGWSV